MNFNFLKFKKIYFFFSGILILGSLVCLIIFGLKPGIDFTGGSILEVEYKQERPSNKTIEEKLADIDLGKIHVQPAGERGVILRMKDIDEDTHQEVLQKLKEINEVEEKRFEAIGPAIGSELKKTTKIVIIFSLLAILLYIAFAFRRISQPVKSWQYGIAALLALFHDVLIPLGVFSVLGKIYGIQITIPVVVALLTVLGYSINDTVVVFDRIRENLWKITGISFEETVNKSFNQTLVRSISASLTTLFPLTAIFFFGGETLKYFSLALIIGIFLGTYSSIFIASSLLVSWSKWRKRA